MGWIAWLVAGDEPVPIEEPPIAVEVEVDAESREVAATGRAQASHATTPPASRDRFARDWLGRRLW